MNANRLIARAEEKAGLLYQTPLAALESWQLHQALGEALMEEIAPQWQGDNEKRSGSKQAFYLSMEYLIGRMVFNNLYCAGMLKEADELLFSNSGGRQSTLATGGKVAVAVDSIDHIFNLVDKASRSALRDEFKDKESLV